MGSEYCIICPGITGAYKNFFVFVPCHMAVDHTLNFEQPRILLNLFQVIVHCMVKNTFIFF